MKKLTTWILAALGSLAVVGCDPFENAVNAPPAVISVGLTEVDSAGNITANVGTGAGANWTITAPAICGNTTAGVAEAPGFIWVLFNVLLDGSAIQTDPAVCRPAPALAFTASAPPAGDSWWTCYSPQSPVPEEGASVIIFLDPTVAAPGGPSGWISDLPLPASGNVNTNYTFGGTAYDKQGRGAAFNVALTVTPDPGVPGTPTFTAVTATSLTVNWTAPGCGTVTTGYTVQRAPDVAGAPGTFVTVGTTAAGVTTFADTGLTTATKYWYQVIAAVTAGTTTSASASVTTL